jgi:hypothetical protein
MLTRHVCGERCLHRFPEQWFTDELTSCHVNLPRPHRLPGSLQYQRYGLKYWAHLGGNRPRFTRIGRGSAQQLVVERADSRKLNPVSRVRTCPV